MIFQKVKPNFLDVINKQKPFVVWSKPGLGSVSRVIEHFNDDEHCLFVIRMSLVNDTDISDSNLLTRVHDDAINALSFTGKKLVFLFEDLTHASKAALDVISTMIVERRFFTLSLDDHDIVMATGLLDVTGQPLAFDLNHPLVGQMTHYVVEQG